MDDESSMSIIVPTQTKIEEINFTRKKSMVELNMNDKMFNSKSLKTLVFGG